MVMEGMENVDKGIVKIEGEKIRKMREDKDEELRGENIGIVLK